MSAIPRVARKTITTIQDGSVYKERWAGQGVFPAGYSARIVFYDSAKNVLSEVYGDLDGSQVLFSVPYADVETVPNGAFFDCLITDNTGDDHLFRYGSVFRRQNFFPNSSTDTTSSPVRYEDDFQRPAGPLGSRWLTLVGQARIFTNPSLAGGNVNTVGPNYNFFSRYYVRYRDPYESDTVAVALSVIDKGPGTTIFTLATNSDASSYLYVGWYSPTSGSNTIEVGYGTAPDVGSLLNPAEDVLVPKDVEIMNISNTSLDRFRVRYSDMTRTISVYNEDGSTKYLSWTDEDEVVPHGKGCRYFGIGGNTGLFNSGVQVAYAKVQDDV